MGNKVFLGGTCNNSKWRDELIPLLDIDYFNPVVNDWTSECQQIEMDEKENKCNIHLYVITSEMTGVFSIAEVIDSAHNEKVTTIFYVIRSGFTKGQLRSLDAVANLVRLRGETAVSSPYIYSGLAHFINNVKKGINMGNKVERPTWNKYFIGIALDVSTRATCTRRKVGAVIVKDNRILSSGYNGAPSGIDHCDKTGCLREKLNIPSGERAEICRGVHGEQNAIIQAAYYGISIKGSILYCTDSPCFICAKMIINSGIQKIYYLNEYPDKMSFDMLKEAGIKVVKLGG